MHGKENTVIYLHVNSVKIFKYQINCCYLSLKKVCSGILILVTSSWVGATQFLKVTYKIGGSKTNATNFGLQEYLHHHRDDILVSYI